MLNSVYTQQLYPMQYTVIQDIYFKLEDLFQKKTLELVRKM